MDISRYHSQIKSCVACLNGDRSRSVDFSNLRSQIINYPEEFFKVLAEALQVKSAGSKVLQRANRLLFAELDEHTSPMALFVVVRQAAHPSDTVVEELADGDTLYIIDPHCRGPILAKPASQEVIASRRIEEAEKLLYRQESEKAIQALNELAGSLLPLLKAEAENCEDLEARTRAMRALEVPTHNIQHIARVCGIIGLPIEVLIKKLL